VSRVNAFLGADQSQVQVEQHLDSGEILEAFKVNAAIRDALKPRVDLPSGGYVIIEPTEALTVIDVNSGSFTRSANARETVLWTNYEAATEIARQLKLRNIGGVVIIDFIDMESRRDQLQVLEHFTAALRPDSARPQIAQISELGLVELTRKRQGQNIYELFGRACPSCGGLGHVAVLPGKDSLQPLAAAPGLVRSAASARAEVLSPAGGESGSGRRRRGGRGGRGGSDAPELSSYDDTVPAGVSNDAATAAAEPSSRRPEPELVAVPMDPEQELVYGWLGLNPALLLDPVPAADNLVVRVVRPGEDAEAVLEEARQQLAAAGPRRRRRGRGGANGQAAGAPVPPAAAPMAVPTESLPVTVEITPLPVETFPSYPSVAVLPDSGLELVAAAAEPAAVNGRRVRSRRRSEATATAAAAVAVLPVEEASAPSDAAPAESNDDASEPRRRRRRSSAAE
jgi:ribonuclease E